MSRAFGQLRSSAWRDDEDWRSLTSDAQWLYALLISQPDISAAGHLDFAVNRWIRMAKDMTRERFTAALEVLTDDDYVIVDADTDELLVRTFARTNTQWANSKRVRALSSAVEQIHSPSLRTALAAEMAKVGRSADGSTIDPPDESPEPSVNGSTNRSTEGSTEASPGSAPMSESSVNRSVEPSTNRSVNRSRGRARQDGRRETGDGRASGGGALRPASNIVQDLITEFVADCEQRPPGSYLTRLGKQASDLLDHDTSVADVRGGLAIVARRGLQPTALPGAVHEHLNRGSDRRGTYTDAAWDAATPTAGDLGAFDDEPRPEGIAS